MNEEVRRMIREEIELVMESKLAEIRRGESDQVVDVENTFLVEQLKDEIEELKDEIEEMPDPELQFYPDEKPDPPPRPWQINRAGGLDVDMVDGVLFTSNSTTGVPVAQSVTTSTITLPNNATTKIWFKAEVSNTAFATFFVIWTVDTVTVSSGSSLPADTLDLTDIATGAGDVYVEIAEVTTLDGAVTGITQLLSDSYYLVFPLGIDAGPFACPEPAP